LELKWLEKRLDEILILEMDKFYGIPYSKISDE